MKIQWENNKCLCVVIQQVPLLSGDFGWNHVEIFKSYQIWKYDSVCLINYCLKLIFPKKFELFKVYRFRGPRFFNKESQKYCSNICWVSGLGHSSISLRKGSFWGLSFHPQSWGDARNQKWGWTCIFCFLGKKVKIMKDSW